MRRPWQGPVRTLRNACVGCGAPQYPGEQRIRRVQVGEVTSVQEYRCRECSEVVFASKSDLTEPYLEAWRSHPEEMAVTVDRWSELREIE